MGKMDKGEASEQADLALKPWDTPTFERYDARRETQGKYATVIEFTTTTGPGS